MSPASIVRRLALAAALALTLAACGGAATPQLIGSYPRAPESGAGPPAFTAPPSNYLVVYSANLDLQVRDVDAAADRAIQLAVDHDGYLAASQSWRNEGRKYTRLTLAVPVAYYDAVHDGLLNLGTLLAEDVSGDLVRTGRYQDDWNTYTHLTVSLRPEPPLVSLPRVTGVGGWNPAETFARAFGVVAVIFQFLVDLLIWLVVLVGPFVLIGLGVRAAWRRWRRPHIY